MRPSVRVELLRPPPFPGCQQRRRMSVSQCVLFDLGQLGFDEQRAKDLLVEVEFSQPAARLVVKHQSGSEWDTNRGLPAIFEVVQDLGLLVQTTL